MGFFENILDKKSSRFEKVNNLLQGEKRRAVIELIANIKRAKSVDKVPLLEQLSSVVEDRLVSASLPSSEDDIAYFIERFAKLESDAIEHFVPATAPIVAKEAEPAAATVADIPVGSAPRPQRVMSERMRVDEALQGDPVVAAPTMTPDAMRIKRATNPQVEEVKIPEVAVVSGTPVSEHSRPVGKPLHSTVEGPRFWNGPDKVPMPTLGKDFDEMK